MVHDLETSRVRREPHIWFLMEVVVVSTTVLGLVCLVRHLSEQQAGIVIPWVLTLGALLPTLARGRGLNELGIQLGRVRQDLVLLGAGAVSVFVVGVIARGMLDRLLDEPPLTAAVQENRWVVWVLFQIAYVALPEELFFRGYFLGGSARLLGWDGTAGRSSAEYGGMVLSAGLFAIFHALSFGSPISLLTFFPGLLFAWVYVRMQTIVAPVLLHTAANMGYAIMASDVV